MKEILQNIQSNEKKFCLAIAKFTKMNERFVKHFMEYKNSISVFYFILLLYSTKLSLLSYFRVCRCCMKLSLYVKYCSSFWNWVACRNLRIIFSSQIFSPMEISVQLALYISLHLICFRFTFNRFHIVFNK